MKLSEKKIKDLYILMKRCRRFEERVAVEYRKGRISGPVHTAVGQEAISSGACGMLRTEDYMMTTHRGHADIVAKGGNFSKLLAELFGKRDGYGKGKLGSMHLVAPECNVLGCSAIVAASIPQAAGVAMACKKLNNNRIIMCFLGDGSTFEGAFHEGMTMASAFNLPVVYVCQNNHYAISTCTSDYLKVPDLSQRAQAYGMPGYSVDGNDLMVVAEVVGDAIEKARSGDGPSFINAVTNRFLGHGLYEDGKTYRGKKDVEEIKKNDPITRCYDYLSENKIINEKEDNEIDLNIDKELDAAVEFALNSPEPDLEELFRDVYAEEI